MKFHRFLFFCFIFLQVVMFSVYSQSLLSDSIDGAMGSTDGVSYIFKGSLYWEIDVEAETLLSGPQPLNELNWPGMTFTRIDAVLDWDHRYCYFFSGEQYIRFNKGTGRADDGYPKRITDRTWPGLGFTTVDAVFNAGNGKAYFFSDDEVVRYDIPTDRADSGYPRAVSRLFRGFDISNVDAGFSSGNKGYLISGSRIFRFDATRLWKDSGFPQELSTFFGQEEEGESQGSLSYTLQEKTLDLSPYYVHNANSVLGRVFHYKLSGGDTLVAFNQKDDTVILRFNRKGQQLRSVVYEDKWFSDLLPLEDGSYYLLLGEDRNNTYINGYPNTLLLYKLSSRDTEEYNTYIFGGTGHGPGKSWFDGRSRGKLAYNGKECGVYFEVQKNWADPGQNDDIHNGDMFVVVDSRGKILDDRTHFWTASHSSTIQVDAAPSGEFWTMTIGDAYPYGLQVYNRDKDFNHVVWPPKEDYVPYEEVNSTNAAGILEFLDADKEGFIALMGTLDHPNIGVFTKVDPLFLRLNSDGSTIVRKVWLDRDSTFDASSITAALYNGNYIILWGPGNDYDQGWKAQNAVMAIVKPDGTIIRESEGINAPFGSYSVLKAEEDGVSWVLADNGSSKVQLFQLVFK